MTEDEKRKKLAALKWEAVEGFLHAPVSPLARNVGVLIVTRADMRQRSPHKYYCYLSAVNMATRLGVTKGSIAMVLKELRDNSLIEGDPHGGPNHQGRWTPNWR